MPSQPSEECPSGRTRVRFEVYTFGEPRVGNDAFARYVISLGTFPSPCLDFICKDGIEFHRSVYHNDPIPHLPPREINLPHPLAHTDDPMAMEWDVKQDGQRTTGVSNWIQFQHHSHEYYIVKGKQTTYSCDAATRNDTDGRISEDPRCSAQHRVLNLWNHLNYWHINYGPWC
jgi:hypothetical protein